MPKIYIVGGKSINITEQQAIKLAGWKWGLDGANKMPDDKVVDLRHSGLGIFTLKDIKRIEFEEKPLIQYNDYKEELLKAKFLRQEYSNQDSFSKTERMIRTNCFLLYVVRGNRKDGRVENRHEALFREPYYSLLFGKIFEWFEKNTQEPYCPMEVWESIIPFGERKVVSSGWKSLI